jgi:hypothetical protein
MGEAEQKVQRSRKVYNGLERSKKRSLNENESEAAIQATIEAVSHKRGE